MAAPERFTASVDDGGRGRGVIRVPLDADAAWGSKQQHHVHGTIGGRTWRGPLRRTAAGWELVLGPAWLRDNPPAVGDTVAVELEAEGPQTAELAPDLAAAFESSPQAAAFFAGLATFYRKGYLRWLDGAARRPQLRAQRVRELVRYLEEGRKQRPR